MLTINDLTNSEEEFYRFLMDAIKFGLRVACPGIIQTFDPNEQTVTVQPAIRERIRDPKTLTYSWVRLPLLVDVPIVLPRAGGFALTLPISPGDECLLVFGDSAMDGWWANGGVQNTPGGEELRRHDLSDAYAIVGLWSQPRTLSNYSTVAAQLRTDDGTAYISLSSSGIDLVAPTNSIKANGAVIG